MVNIVKTGSIKPLTYLDFIDFSMASQNIVQPVTVMVLDHVRSAGYIHMALYTCTAIHFVITMASVSDTEANFDITLPTIDFSQMDSGLKGEFDDGIDLDLVSECDKVLDNIEEKSRYQRALTDNDLKEAIKNQVPQKTRKQNSWALRVWEDWAT